MSCHVLATASPAEHENHYLHRVRLRNFAGEYSNICTRPLPRIRRDEHEGFACDADGEERVMLPLCNSPKRLQILDLKLSIISNTQSLATPIPSILRKPGLIENTRDNQKQFNSPTSSSKRKPILTLPNRMIECTAECTVPLKTWVNNSKRPDKSTSDATS